MISRLSHILRDHYQKKKKMNSKFSMRFLAQQLSISPSQISMLLSGQRLPSLVILPHLAQILDIDKEVEDSLRLIILKNRNGAVEPQDVSFSKLKNTASSTKKLKEPLVLAEAEQFIALKSWHYFAIMQTTLLKKYNGKVSFISDFLGIPPQEAEEYVKELMDAKLMSRDKKTGHVVKSQSNMQFRSRKRDQLRQHHISNMEKAISTLRNHNTHYNLDNRLITSSAFSCKKDQIPLLKQKVQNFIQSMAHTDHSEGHDEVCQLSIQLFPLSKR